MFIITVLIVFIFTKHILFADLINLAADYTNLSFFIEENIERYKKFANKNQIPFDKAVRLVNSGADLIAYTDIYSITNPSCILTLCTKNRRLPDDYEPANLRSVNGTHILLREEAALALESMIDAMNEDGLTIVLISGYRSLASQKSLFDRRVREYGSISAADKDTARAGHSEHQTGLAVDLLQRTVRPLGNANFQNTRQYKWLLENAYKYGYILRYPKNYEHITGFSYEPWHWRYIGIDAAAAMKDGEIKVFEKFWGEISVTLYNIENECLCMFFGA